jgi:hypothetical protein
MMSVWRISRLSPPETLTLSLQFPLSVPGGPLKERVSPGGCLYQLAATVTVWLWTVLLTVTGAESAKVKLARVARTL